jgi:hypothetical protein
MTALNTIVYIRRSNDEELRLLADTNEAISAEEKV